MCPKRPVAGLTAPRPPSVTGHSDFRCHYGRMERKFRQLNNATPSTIRHSQLWRRQDEKKCVTEHRRDPVWLLGSAVRPRPPALHSGFSRPRGLGPETQVMAHSAVKQPPRPATERGGEEPSGWRDAGHCVTSVTVTRHGGHEGPWGWTRRSRQHGNGLPTGDFLLFPSLPCYW